MQIGHARGQWYGQQAGTGIARISNLASGGHGHAKIRAGMPVPDPSLLNRYSAKTLEVPNF